MPKERKPDLGNVSRGSHAGCSALCSSTVRSAVLDVTYYSNLCEVDVVSGLRLAKAFSGLLFSSEQWWVDCDLRLSGNGVVYYLLKVLQQEFVNRSREINSSFSSVLSVLFV